MKKAARDHLASLDDGAAGCKGDVHDFPKLRPGKKWPKGVTVVKQVDGSSQLVYTCPDCGTVRRRDTTRQGVIITGPRHRYSYWHPKGYLAPKGAGLTRADYARELGQRLAPMVREAVKNGGRPGQAKSPKQAKPRGNTHATNPRARSQIRQGEQKMVSERENRHGQVPPASFSGEAS